MDGGGRRMRTGRFKHSIGLESGAVTGIVVRLVGDEDKQMVHLSTGREAA